MFPNLNKAELEKLEAKQIDIDSPMYILNLKLKADLAKFTEQYMGLFIKL